MAAKSISSSAYEVSMITLDSGKRRTISSQASIPDVPGRRISMTTTSGCVNSTCSMASRAEPASPTTSKCGWRSIKAFNPKRTTSWSSTSKIRCLVMFPLVSLFFCLPSKIDKPVTHAALGKDIFGVGGVFFQLLAQVIDVQAHVMRFVAVFVAPDFCQ